MRKQVHRPWWACAGFGALILSTIVWPGIAAGQGVLTAGRAPDPTGKGKFAVATSQYRLPASVDPTIMTDRATEIWARVWRPRTEELERLPLVVFLHGNHGTCGTFFCSVANCGRFIPLPDGPRIDDRIDYTTTGTCPRKGEGTPPAEFDYVVSPSHEGYAYLAEQLASRGYLVVSINANRGITAGAFQDLGTPGNPFVEDRGLNLARARLTLKHLELLSRWNRGIEPTPSSLGFSLRGAIDFRNVALVGHSRGGEGVRGAYNIYTGRNTDINPYASIDWRSRIADPVDLKGIFEIAPVDRQTVRTLNAEGTTWSVMLPGCDGDVINQQGMWPYDRMMKSFAELPARQKAFYYVLGANHNYWNTEWQFSDSSGCFSPAVQLFETDPATGVLPGVTGSARQRTTGSASILALIRGTLGEGAVEESFGFLRNFDPQYTLPPVVTAAARIQRGFIASPNSEVTLALEDFEQPAGTSQFGVPNQASNVTVEHVGVIEHGIPFSTRDAHLTRVPLPAFVRGGRITWQRAGADVYFQINFANAGQGLDLSDYATLDFRVDRETPSRTALNPASASNFHVQLVAADGTLSEPVAASNFIQLDGPFGTPDADLTPPATFPDGYHLNLPTARIPIEAFRSDKADQTRGVRLIFDDTASGKIYVTNFRASRQGRSFLGEGFDPSGALGAIFNVPSLDAFTGWPSQGIIAHEGVIEDVQFVPAAGIGAAATNGGGTVRFSVRSETPIPVGNELAIMSIGAVQCDGSYVDGSTQRMMFECPAQGLALAEGEPIIVRSNARSGWKFGTFSTKMLN
ncbi:MAG TPA: hypothetical protein VOA41_20465 [Candidatus Dormibacteraeota bacterium]|nr:hypothetical protein [Candidatus Dormibacteraeota bacterium]